jgi:hypothetical protein
MRQSAMILLTALLYASAGCVDDTADNADAAPARLDAGDDRARDSVLETVTNPDGTNLHDTAPAEAPDAVTDTVAQDCFALSEQACVSNTNCTRIRGLSLDDFCAGRLTAAAFKGCVSGGPDGGAAVIWAREDRNGETAQFSTTQLPAGWKQVNMPACADGGTD